MTSAAEKADVFRLRREQMSYTLLLVDDEEEIRTSIAELVDFKAAGFELVGQASNGFEALELTERLSPDLILSDIKMPYMTGL